MPKNLGFHLHRVGDPEIFESTDLTFFRFLTALDWTVTGCTWPRHATLARQSFTTWSHRGRGCFWFGGGDEIELGGADPRKYVLLGIRLNLF